MILVAGDAELVLAPELGGAVVSWRVAHVDVLRPGSGAEVRDQACYPLVPFSNRVAGGAFIFRGQRHALPTLLGPWAIHGAGWQSHWEMTGNEMVLDYRGGVLWPFAFRAEQIFELTPRSLSVTMRLTNRHASDAPAAIGLHPFFNRAPMTTLQFAARAVWHNDIDMIPETRTSVPPAWDFSRPRVPDVAIDNCFLGWRQIAAITQPDHSLRLTADAVFRHLVVYCPPASDIMAIEPVSNMNDGLNRMDDPDCGMTVLPPGGVLEGRITMDVLL
jgi:aldose 1-epimerase